MIIPEVDKPISGADSLSLFASALFRLLAASKQEGSKIRSSQYSQPIITFVSSSRYEVILPYEKMITPPSPKKSSTPNIARKALQCV